MKNSQTLNRIAPSRRGITLLFVVSMIVLFLLMGTTFVVVSNDYLKSARRRSHNDLVRDPGRPLLERAFYELVRGPSLRNTTSPLRGHSLLADLYGYGYKAEVSTASIPTSGLGGADITGGQFFDLELRAPNGGAGNQGQSLRDGVLRPFSAADELINDAYNGLLMTFTTGNAAGLTVRIVDYIIESSGAGLEPTVKFRVAPEWSSDDVFKDQAALNGLVSSEVIINGMPFGGTGAGGFTSGSTLESAELEPNRVGESFANLCSSSGTLGFLSNDNGPNEPWDAPDHQNMFMAYDNGATVIPSFQRRYLTGSRTNFNEFSEATDSSGARLEMLVDNDGDGALDGIWMDIGLPVQTDSSGRYIKPLVSYKVIDLDGRANLNAAGSLADTDPATNGYMTTPDMFLNGTAGQQTNTLPRGQGYGPPEISLSGILGTEYLSLLQGRYGDDNVPGEDTRDARSRDKLFGYPTSDVDPTNDSFGTLGRLYASSAMDIHGRFAFGTPMMTNALSSIAGTEYDLSDPNVSGFPNGLPGIDLLTSNLSSIQGMSNVEVDNSPYEMNFALAPFGDANDSPYTPQELERLLRTQDRDVYMLPPRLWDIADDAFNNSDPVEAAANRRAVTTESWSIPSLPESQAGLIRKLAQKLADERSTDISDEFENARNMLPPEFLAGLKMNVNREFGNGLDDNGDGVIDEPGEVNTDSGGQMNGFTQKDKINYARQLYLLTLLVSDPVDFDIDGDGSDDNYERIVAQWCANVVDFRDPDSIMTTIEFDSNPFNGTDVDEDIGTNDADSMVIRGVERPELLLTEAVALHDRRSEDLSPGGMSMGGSDETYDNRLRPQAAAFVELYNPWVQNAHNQIFDSALYKYDNDTANEGWGVDLAAVSESGSESPIWRIAVRRPKTEDASQPMIRAVYFTHLHNDITETDASSGVLVFSPSAVFTPERYVRPGMHAVFGTGGDPNFETDADTYRTPIGRLDTITQADEGSANSLRLDETRSISLKHNDVVDAVQRFEWNELASPARMEEQAFDAVAVIIDSPRPFSLSDPTVGYWDNLDPSHVDYQTSQFIGDGYAFDSPDGRLADDPGPNPLPQREDTFAQIMENGSHANFRELDLQRLADPTQAWDATYNPYVTIDRIGTTLTTYNGVQTDPANSNAVGDPGHPDYITAPLMDQNTDFRSRERGFEYNEGGNRKRLLWRTVLRDNDPVQDDFDFLNSADGHNLSYEFKETLGVTNDWYVDPDNDVFNPADPVAYPWLQWNNRPFVSHLELANVPAASPELLTQQFSIDSGVDPYDSLVCPFGHMLNFSSRQLKLYRIFDYLEVPSRFVGTEQVLNRSNFDTAPFNYLSRYRVPGKININTVANGKVWNGLMRQFGGDSFDGGVTFGNYSMTLGLNSTTSAPKVFKPAHAARYTSSAPEDPIEGSLYRKRESNSMPLFDYKPANELAFNNTERSPYFRNQMRQRLGNLITTQSNVYAIWITIGYFEYDPTEQDPAVASSNYGATPDLDDSNDHESEVGYDMGLIKRSRAFYIFDRSIPMGFEPGKNHNVDRGILAKSIIED